MEVGLNEATANLMTQLFLGENRLLFDGPLRELDWHRHSFACVLIGVDGPIVITGPSKEDEKVGRVVLAGAAVEHRLEFEARRVISVYIPAHDATFEKLGHARQETLAAGWTHDWEHAVKCWDEGRDASALSSQIEATFCKEDNVLMDRRVRKLMRLLHAGKHLKAGTRDVAISLGISPSRLSALLKESTGSPLGRLQIAYRFWHAASAMLNVETFTDAAHAASFADAAHFSRAFRQSYGLPPSEIVIEKAAFWPCNSVG